MVRSVFSRNQTRTYQTKIIFNNLAILHEIKKHEKTRILFIHFNLEELVNGNEL
jgi:hypothetical protein